MTHPSHSRRHCLVAAVLAVLALMTETVRGVDPAASFPTGRWKSQIDGLTLVIEADGSFTILPPKGKRSPLSGRWRESQGVVTFRNNADEAVCPDAPGRYRWSRDTAGSLRFELVEDSCPPRTMHMQRPFDPVVDE